MGFVCFYIESVPNLGIFAPRTFDAMAKRLLFILLLAVCLLPACTSTETPMQPLPTAWSQVEESPVETDLEEKEDGREEAKHDFTISFYRFSFVIDWF